MDEGTNKTLLEMKHDPFEGIRLRVFGKESKNRPAVAFLIILVVAYLPVLLLSFFDRTLYRLNGISFLGDYGVQFRFLIAVPLLIFSRPIINVATSVTCQHIRDVLLNEDDAKNTFLPALEKVRSINEAPVSRFIMLIIVVAMTVLIYYFSTHSASLISVAGWHGRTLGGELVVSKAYLWYTLVSMSIFRFILLRWFWSYCCWVWLLLKVSKCELKLTPHHSDKACGLNLLVFPQSRFNLFFVALAITSVGVHINDIYYLHAELDSIKIQVAILLAISFIMLLGPYLFFSGKLFKAKRDVHVSQAKKSHQLSEDYDRVWIQTNVTGINDEDKPDPSVMIDYNSTYEISEKIRPFAFSLQDVIQLAVPILLAHLPILLTKMSVKELLQIVLRLVV
jgi:hypothetical protein